MMRVKQQTLKNKMIVITVKEKQMLIVGVWQEVN